VWLRRAPEALRREHSGVSLESVALISVAKALPHVQQGKRHARLKLVDVAELVQE
jgi:hypothetical protein